MNSYDEAIALQKQGNGVITMEEFRAFVRDKKWTFAKTMPQAPHEYIVKGKLSAADQIMFEKAAQFIRDAGFICRYFKSAWQYYILDDYYYWTMGNPIPETTILNRASLGHYEIKNGHWMRRV